MVCVRRNEQILFATKPKPLKSNKQYYVGVSSRINFWKKFDTLNEIYDYVIQSDFHNKKIKASYGSLVIELNSK